MKPIRGENLPLIQLANLLGVSPRTLNENVRQGCPAVERGGKGKETILNSYEWLRWHDARTRSENRDNRSTPGGTALADSKERIAAAKAQREELALAEKRKELFPLAYMVEDTVELYTEFRQFFYQKAIEKGGEFEKWVAECFNFTSARMKERHNDFITKHGPDQG